MAVAIHSTLAYLLAIKFEMGMQGTAYSQITATFISLTSLLLWRFKYSTDEMVI